MTIEAAAELCLLLRELGHDVEITRRPPGVRAGERTLEVVDTEQSSKDAVRKVVAGGSAMVLASTVLRPPHREAVAEAGAGWLDRDGHLSVPALGVDQPVRPLAAPVPPVADLWQRPSVVAVAFALLQLGGPVPNSFDLAFYAGLTHPTAGRAVTDLRSLGMIDEEDQPRHEALQTQLAARWSTRWFGLASLPDVEAQGPEAQVVLGVQDDLRLPGWADLAPDLPPAGSEAAGAGRARRPKLLLPHRRALAWALRTWGRAEPADAVGFVATAPHTVAAAQRRPPAPGERWPRAHPIAPDLESFAPGPHVASDGPAGAPSRIGPSLHE
jgi:hypothetical protein